MNAASFPPPLAGGGQALRALTLALVLSLTACGNMLERLSEVGQPPRMTQPSDPTREPGWRPVTMPMPTPRPLVPEANSLWRPGGRAFFADQRAAAVALG